MYSIALMFALISSGQPDLFQSYFLEKEYIKFIYPSRNSNLEIYVSGNFNGWTKSDDNWRMIYNPIEQNYQLRRLISEVRTANRSFYEFTYRIDKTLVDADPRAKDVIHCAGYGYRYVIRWD